MRALPLPRTHQTHGTVRYVRVSIATGTTFVQCATRGKEQYTNLRNHPLIMKLRVVLVRQLVDRGLVRPVELPTQASHQTFARCASTAKISLITQTIMHIHLLTILYLGFVGLLTFCCCRCCWWWCLLAFLALYLNLITRSYSFFYSSIIFLMLLALIMLYFSFLT